MTRSALLAALLVLALLQAGCANPETLDVPFRDPACFNEGVAPPPEDPPEAAPLVKKLGERISERELVELALLKNHELNLLRLERRAARSRLYQAGLYLYNPQFFAGVDDLAVIDHHPQNGTGPYPGKAEYGISQQLEFPTKRGRRVELNEALVRVADSDFESKERDVKTSVRTAFVDTLAAEERLLVAQKNLDISARLHEAAAARVAAKASPAIEETKAEADELGARNDVKVAERDIAIARSTVAQLLGDASLKIGVLDGALALDGPELAYDGAKPVERHPALVSKGHSLDAAQANLEVQKRVPLPDPTLFFSYNRVRGDTDVVTANIFIPIPILNSNRGAIHEAAVNVEKAATDLQLTRVSLITQYRQGLWNYDTARLNAKRFREKTLPATEKSLALAEEGWKAGKLKYLDVLDAQRSLNASRADYVSALQDLNHAVIQIEALTGVGVSELKR